MRRMMILAAALGVLSFAVTQTAMAETSAPSCHRGVSAKLDASASPEVVTKHKECPVMAWEKWNAEHPEQPSVHRARMMANASGHKHSHPAVTTKLNVDSSEYYDEDEPDPGFGKCGCPPEVALAGDGCGWIHSNIYQIVLAKVRRINPLRLLPGRSIPFKKTV